MGSWTGESFATKEGVREILSERATAPDVRNAPAQLVTLFGKLADWVRQHRWIAAHWLEGELVIEVTPLGSGSQVRVSSNLGFGLCAQIFLPVTYEEVLFDDIDWIADNVPELASPLTVHRSHGRVRFELLKDWPLSCPDDGASALSLGPPAPDTVRALPLDPDATLSVPTLTAQLLSEMDADAAE